MHDKNATRHGIERLLTAFGIGAVTLLPLTAARADSVVPPDPSVCPAGAADFDADGLCDAAEAMYGTDPKLPDTDHDALSDAAELFGVMVDGIGDSPQHLDLAALGAKPLHRDVFVEIDYYPGKRPDEAALHLVEDAFDAAPLANPDGKDGIKLHYLIDQEIAAADAKPNLGPANGTDLMGLAVDVYREFEPIKEKYASYLRHAVFHYALYVQDIEQGQASGNSFGSPGHDFVVATRPKGQSENDASYLYWKAGTFMHELGHNLGLAHGGDDDLKYKPNYLSVMSYLYQGGLWRDHGFALDYSRHPVAALPESALDERLGLSPAEGTTRTDLDRYGIAVLGGFNSDGSYYTTVLKNEDAGHDIDWNRDGVIDSMTYASDLDMSGDVETFKASQNDWNNLVFDAGGAIGQVRTPRMSKNIASEQLLPPCALAAPSSAPN